MHSVGGQGPILVDRAPAEPGPASHGLASGWRSRGHLDRPGLAWSASRALIALSSVAGHRSPSEPDATRDHGPTRRADAPPDRVRYASQSSRLPIPLWSQRARKRARTRAFNEIAGQHHRAGGATPESNTPTPQSKPVTQASRLVARNAPSVAFGLGARILPQGQLTYDCTPIRPVACADPKSCSNLPRIVRLPPAAARPTAYGPRGTMELPDETAAKPNADLRSHQTRAPPGSR
jgi:hypothetical protein